MTRLLALSLVALAVSGCASAPTVTEALGAWRGGHRKAAIEAARGEVERFREGNDISWKAIDKALGLADRLLDDETPIAPPETRPLPSDPAERAGPPDPWAQVGALDRGLREDLAARGVSRTLRAVRVVRRLSLARFAPDLFIAIWRRDPWEPDGPLLAGQDRAMRSVAVKVAALRALETLE